MTTYVFTGPTLSSADARHALDAIYLPPVAQGDVYSIAQERPIAIGIIDGYFQQTPSVWHKEILWAMAHGIHMFGAASLGALRAAELHQFGMRGVGRIFEAYRDGELRDDDEVAVVHGPAELSYVGLCEPMINIRHTLYKASEGGVILKETSDRLVAMAKQTFYTERSYEDLISCAFASTLPREEIVRLRKWLPRNRVDLKRDDALKMLDVMRLFLDRSPEPMTASYALENTLTWCRG